MFPFWCFFPPAVLTKGAHDLALPISKTEYCENRFSAPRNSAAAVAGGTKRCGGTGATGESGPRAAGGCAGSRAEGGSGRDSAAGGSSAQPIAGAWGAAQLPLRAAPVPGAAGDSLPCDSRGGPLLPRRAVPRRPQPCVSLPARDTITREAGRVLEGVGGGGGEANRNGAPSPPGERGGGRLPVPPATRGGSGLQRRQLRPGGRSPLPSARGAVPAGGGDGGGHEQHAAESDRAGAHGRGPADRRAAAVSGAVPLPGLCCGTGVPAGGGRGGSEDVPPEAEHLPRCPPGPGCSQPAALGPLRCGGGWRDPRGESGAVRRRNC